MMIILALITGFFLMQTTKDEVCRILDNCGTGNGNYDSSEA